jgi:hypothetical protein
MKKRFKYIGRLFIVGLVPLMLACEKDFLESEPVDLLTEEILLGDKTAFESHMANLYSQMGFERIGIWLSYNTDEMVNCFSGQNTALLDGPMTFTSNPEVYNWWENGYKLIRDLNNVIEKFPASTAYSGEEKSEVFAELRFMRAYAYFKLARGYGGVPIITEVLSLPESGDPTALYAPRDKESDVFKFIETEMTEAIEMMSDVPTEYRLHKWSALAFKTRAMIHAASIATYGELQLDGVIGIPSSEAEHYWESARNTAKQVMDSGIYELYNYEEDKTANYHKLFFDESATNKERIFVTAYEWPVRAHEIDRNTAPFSHRSGEGYGSYFNPTLDMVESFEYTNDRDGSLKMTNEDGSPIVYENPADLFQNKDSRFFASVLFPGSPWKGTTLEVYGNIIEGGVLKDGHGADGIAQPEATSTGFLLSKWSDPSPPRPISGSSSDVDRISIRYAEVLMDYAEAELELGNEPEARKYVNMIRQRAGLAEFTSPITMEDYRQERKVEFAFEGNRYWDMKRWRIFHEVVFNSDTYGVWPVYNTDNNTYTFSKQKLPAEKFTRTYTPNMYYYKISTDIVEINTLLVQNPGY